MELIRQYKYCVCCLLETVFSRELSSLSLCCGGFEFPPLQQWARATPPWISVGSDQARAQCNQLLLPLDSVIAGTVRV